MKILLCANTAYSMLNFRGNLIKSLIELGHTVYVVAPADNSKDDLEKLGVIFRTWNLSRTGTNPLSEIRSIFHLFKIFSQIKPDLVISYTIKPNCYAPILSKLLSIPIICMVPGLGFSFSNKGLVAYTGRKLLTKSLKLASSVFTLNKSDADTLRDQDRELEKKIIILPGEGVNTSHYVSQNYPASLPLSFSYIGRLLKDKGIEEFIEAARKLKKRNQQADFIIMGPPDKGNPAEINFEVITRAQKEGVITYIEERKDVREVINNSHCIVLPSFYREGMPRILLEAASMERPMIATNIPGCNDIVIDQETGLLCEPRSVESLIKTMESFISLSHEEKIHMGKRARQRVIDHFSDEIVIKKYEEVIDKVMREHKAKV